MNTSILTLLAAGAGDTPPAWIQFMPLIAMALIFWFLIIRPQMRRQKEHAAKIGGLKKGDQVMLGGGIVGKVTRVDDDYADVEIAQGVRVKTVKSTIADIIPPGAPPAND
ncbi:MAG: preprotein translocase subunit YajC [Sphingomonadaceae bacterium]